MKAIFEKYNDPLTRYAKKMLKNESSIVDDIVQTAFIKTWQNQKNVKNLNQYLYKTVHNLCLNYIRDNSRFTEFNDIILSDIEYIPYNEKQIPDYKFLPKKQRKSIDLYLKYGSLTIACKQLNLNISTQRTSYNLAINKIKAKVL